MYRGYVKLWRKIEDSGLLDDPELLRLFVYLLIKATRKPHRIIRRGEIVRLEPGQYLTSIRRLASRFGTSRHVVQHRLNLLQNMKSIDTHTGHLGTIISICNWEIYQASSKNLTDTEADTEADTELEAELETKLEAKSDTRRTPGGQTPDAQETRKEKKEEKRKRKKTRKKYSEVFLRWYRHYPLKRGKYKAFEHWEKMELDDEVDDIITATQRQIEERRRAERECQDPWIPPWPNASTYINQCRWEDSYLPVELIMKDEGKKAKDSAVYLQEDSRLAPFPDLESLKSYARYREGELIRLAEKKYRMIGAKDEGKLRPPPHDFQ